MANENVVAVPIATVQQWREDWLQAYAKGDGTDEVTPFDDYLLGSNGLKTLVQAYNFQQQCLAEGAEARQTGALKDADEWVRESMDKLADEIEKRHGN